MSRKTNRPKCAEGYRYLKGYEIVRGTDEVEIDTHLGQPLERWDVVDAIRHPNKGRKVSLEPNVSYRRKVEAKATKPDAEAKPVTTSFPGEGYRFLKEDELILASDEAVVGNGDIRPTKYPGEKFYHPWCPIRRKVTPQVKPGKFLGYCAAPMMVRGQSVKVADKDSRFFGATGKVVAVVKNTCRVKYDTPQENEGYKYSWFWANELENNVTWPKFKVGQKVRVKVPGSIFNDNIGKIIQVPDKPYFDYDVLTTVNRTQLWFRNEELNLVEEEAPIDPGEGYRLLKVGEKIVKGDEVTIYGNGWSLVGGSIGCIVCDGDYVYVYRRKIEAEAPTYRFLKVGEMVQPEDTFITSFKRTSNAGNVVVEGLENSYLRKVS